MKQLYVAYWHWEDYKNGMWRRLLKDEEQSMLEKAIVFTGDHIQYGDAMREVSIKWSMTMMNGLTNKSINRRAFLGHCACSYKIDCPEYITRKAWRYLTNQQRTMADHVAQRTIDEWIQNHGSGIISAHGKVGATQMAYQMRLPLS